MTSARPDNLPALRDQLDALSMRALELTQEVIEARATVEAAQREGYIMLAKARYGGAKVGHSQLPDAELDVTACVRVAREECSRQENDVRFAYFYTKYQPHYQVRGESSYALRTLSIFLRVISSALLACRRWLAPARIL